LEFNVPFQHKYGYIRDEGEQVVAIANVMSQCTIKYQTELMTNLPSSKRTLNLNAGHWCISYGTSPFSTWPFLLSSSFAILCVSRPS